MGRKLASLKKLESKEFGFNFIRKSNPEKIFNNLTQIQPVVENL